jgi:hypothetical protein
MGLLSAQNRNKNPDTDTKNRPVNVDERGRLMVNNGLDGDVYSLFLPPIAAGANKVYFDLFNNQALDVEVVSVTPIVSGAAAVVGVLAVDLYLTRTTAVGTGGTAATLEETSLTAASINKFDPRSPALPATITARTAPTGGATAGALLALESVFTEETNAATYQRVNMIKDNQSETRIIVPTGTGIRVVQGGVASVGNVGFQVTFSVVRKS